MPTDKKNDTNRKVLQKCLLYIFNDLPIVPIKLSTPDFSKKKNISDISTSDLIFLMHSFIEGVAYMNKDTDFALNCFRVFLNLIFNLNFDQINDQVNDQDRNQERNQDRNQYRNQERNQESNQERNQDINQERNLDINQDRNQDINLEKYNNDQKSIDFHKKSMMFLHRNNVYNEAKMYGNRTKSDMPLSLSSIWEKIQHDGCDRTAAIFLRKCIKETKSDYIDWNDRDSMIKLIKFSVCKGLLLYNKEENKKAIKMYKGTEKSIKMHNVADDKINSMKLLRIDSRISKEDMKESEKYLNNKGVFFKNVNQKEYQINNKFNLCEKLEINTNDRKDMFIRKNKPEMTLEEFANLALLNFQKREKIIEQIELQKIKQNDNFVVENEELKRLQQSDEFNDTKSNHMGRIRRIG